jgi:hypothetical protein
MIYVAPSSKNLCDQRPVGALHSNTTRKDEEDTTSIIVVIVVIIVISSAATATANVIFHRR